MDSESAYNYVRSKFVTTKTTRKLTKEFDLKFKYGSFSAREAKIARDVIDEFLTEHKLGMDDLQSHLAEETPFPLTELVLRVVARIEHRTFKTIYTHIAFTYHPLITQKFSPEDDLELLQLVQRRGFHWKEIARKLEKYRNHCRIRFLHLKGEAYRYITIRQIKALLQDGLPTTDSGWAEKAKELGVSKGLLVKKVTQYLRSMSFDRNDETYSTILVLLYVLAYNYFCAMSINIKGLICFLRGNYQEEDLLAVQADVSETTTDCGVTLEEDQKSETENIPNQIKMFEDAFKEYFRDGLLDLDVKIEMDDIFWETISRELSLPSNVLKTRFTVLQKAYSLTLFTDILETLKKLSFTYYLDGIKHKLLIHSNNKHETRRKRYKVEDVVR